MNDKTKCTGGLCPWQRSCTRRSYIEEEDIYFPVAPFTDEGCSFFIDKDFSKVDNETSKVSNEN